MLDNEAYGMATGELTLAFHISRGHSSNFFAHLSLCHIATSQPTTQNNLKQIELGWYYYR
jgi:hypothetical protein